MTAAKRTGEAPVDVRLYAVADPARCAAGDLTAAVAAAVRGGATLVQYRDKTATTRKMLERARALKDALQGAGVPLIVNDRVDVALAAGAEGVHLGADDMPAAEARRLMGGEAIIGVTVHDQAEAAAAPVEIADYFGVGPVYATGSKADARAAHGPEGFAALVAALKARAPRTPVVGISGIDESNAGAVMAAGADGIAAVSALFMADDVEKAARALRARVEAVLGRRNT